MERNYDKEILDDCYAVIANDVRETGFSEGWVGELKRPLVDALEEVGVGLGSDGVWTKANIRDIPEAEDMPYALLDDLSKSYFKLGNKKLGSDTVVFNMTSGMDCPVADKCEVVKHCYARADERFRPTALAYRRRQTKFWDSVNASQFVRAFPIPEYFRFSESGDFRTQADVNKMTEVAELLKLRGIQAYGYTRRDDLDMSELSKEAVVNGSGFMLSNQTSVVTEIDPSKPVCPGNCRTCDLCKVARGVDIQFKLRRR